MPTEKEALTRLNGKSSDIPLRGYITRAETSIILSIGMILMHQLKHRLFHLNILLKWK